MVGKGATGCWFNKRFFWGVFRAFREKVKIFRKKVDDFDTFRTEKYDFFEKKGVKKMGKIIRKLGFRTQIYSQFFVNFHLFFISENPKFSVLQQQFPIANC